MIATVHVRGILCGQDDTETKHQKLAVSWCEGVFSQSNRPCHLVEPLAATSATLCSVALVQATHYLPDGDDGTWNTKCTTDNGSVVTRGKSAAAR